MADCHKFSVKLVERTGRNAKDGSILHNNMQRLTPTHRTQNVPVVQNRKSRTAKHRLTVEESERQFAVQRLRRVSEVSASGIPQNQFKLTN